MEKLEFIADQPGERLDSFLSHQQPLYSRSHWQKLCEQGKVSSNERQLKPGHKLKVGERLTILLPIQQDVSNHTVPITYEDDDVIVMNKPAGMLTHAKGAASEEFTVADFVRPRTLETQHTNRPGIVHRLDRGTSGIIIAAKHEQAKQWLQKQFSLRRVKKMYIALVKGRPKESHALLSLPIERNPRHPQTFRVNVNGKAAETEYQFEKIFPHHTLLRLYPSTGRTHQLRVHMAYLDHPIVGDILYGSADQHLARMFLHAAELELTLPDHTRKTFRAPLPDMLTNYLKTLAKRHV